MEENKPAIGQGNVKYSCKLNLTGGDNEYIECDLQTAPDAELNDVESLMRYARAICHKASSRYLQKAAKAQVPSQPQQIEPSKAIAEVKKALPVLESVIAAPEPKQEPAYRPPVTRAKHKYPGFYYGYKFPYRKPGALEEQIKELLARKEIKYQGKPDYMFWSRTLIQEWQQYLVVNGTQIDNATPKQQEFNPQIPDDDDTSDIPF